MYNSLMLIWLLLLIQGNDDVHLFLKATVATFCFSQNGRYKSFNNTGDKEQE